MLSIEKSLNTKALVQLQGFCYTLISNGYLWRGGYFLFTTGSPSFPNSIVIREKKLLSLSDILSKSSWHFLQKLPDTFGRSWCLHSCI